MQNAGYMQGKGFGGRVGVEKGRVNLWGKKEKRQRCTKKHRTHK
jgi:hypothetical protein